MLPVSRRACSTSYALLLVINEHRTTLFAHRLFAHCPIPPLPPNVPRSLKGEAPAGVVALLRIPRLWTPINEARLKGEVRNQPPVAAVRTHHPQTKCVWSLKAEGDPAAIRRIRTCEGPHLTSGVVGEQPHIRAIGL